MKRKKERKRMANYFRDNHNKGALRGAIQSAQGGGRGGRSPRKAESGQALGRAPQPFDIDVRMGALSRQARYSPRGGRKRAEAVPHAGRPGAGGSGSLSLFTATRRAIAPTGRQGEKAQSAHLRPAELRQAGAANRRLGRRRRRRKR